MKNTTDTFTPMDVRMLVAAIWTFALVACAGSKYPLQYDDQLKADVPAYEKLAFWAAHPQKKDPADSTPLPYRSNAAPNESVAIFYIHPTVYTQQAAITNQPPGSEAWNAPFDDAFTNAKTDFTAVLNQASAFNKYPVYAPRYRQAHIATFSLSDSLAKPIFDRAYQDIQTAFNYFLENEAKGKPFIIAAHSQGTLHAAKLIKEMIDGRPLQKNMISAYLIGLPVRDDYFVACKPCGQPAEVNCFVSWRTFKKGYIPEYIQKEPFKAVVVNPITWRTDAPKASRSLHKGALLYKFNKPKTNNVSAQVQGNVLWSTKPRFFGNLFFTRKNYHIGDINLFWKDIRDNVDARVNAYFKAMKQ